MHHHKDFVKATTTSEGTGDIELGSSPSGFKSFAVFSDGQKMDVLVVDNSSDPTNWEVFEATYNTGSPDTLTRGTFRSSNTGSRVNFPAGTKTVVAAPSAVLFSIVSQTLDSNLRTAGSAGTYTVTTVSGLTPYDGYSITVEANHDSPAGGCTLNPDGTGAVAIKLNDGSDPYAGAIKADGKHDFQHDGTSFILKNPYVGNQSTATTSTPEFRGLSFKGATSTTTVTLQLGDPDAAKQGWVEYFNNGDALAFGANGEERARLTADGNFVVGSTSSSGVRTAIISSGTDPILRAYAQHASYANIVVDAITTRDNSSAFNYFTGRNTNGADNDFTLRGDGNGFADGAWTGGGADYAEFFEWADGNPDNEDRRGWAVVLVGDKIKRAEAGETPFGVISGNPSVVGDAAWNRWNEKYLRDDFGTYLQEDYEVVSWTGVDEKEFSFAVEDVPEGLEVPEHAERTIQQRRILNPAWDPTYKYVPRGERKEWDMVGITGKVRLVKGEQVNPTWNKMRDVSAQVEEWFIK